MTTRVQAPDEGDWDKLVHLMQYIRGTHKLSLTLSANISGIFRWWVGELFAVHPNMQGHSSGGLSLGRGFPIVSSKKKRQQKYFHGDINSGRWRLLAIHLLESIFYYATRLQC